MLTIKNTYCPNIFQNIFHSICPCVILLISLCILALARTTNGLSNADIQFPTARYDEYQHKLIYNDEERVSDEKTISSSKGTVNLLLDNTAELPKGYIVKNSNNAIDIGPKIHDGDWKAFLKTYKLVYTITILLVLLMLLVPILGIFYCFFCLKCRGPCYESAIGAQRIICGLFLLLLIIGIIFGIVIAFISNDDMNDGFKQMPKKKASKESTSNHMCKMLEETSEHIKHLFEKNYAHMQNHIEKYRAGRKEGSGSSVEYYENIENSANAQSIPILRKLTTNIPNIPKKLLDLSELVERAWFIADQLRDALRSVKRDITNTLFKKCSDSASTCKNFILIQSIPTLDMGCLHYDLLPNINDTIEAFKNIKDLNFPNYIENADTKLTKFRSSLKGVEEDMEPLILNSLKKGAQILNNQTKAANQKLYKLINDTKRQNTQPRVQNFMKLDAKMGSDRYSFNIIFGIILIIITICLIIGLILVCINKGRFWMLVPIILIFITFSLLTLVGLYYFIMGLVLHRGVCMKSGERVLSVDTFGVSSKENDSTIKGCEGNTSLYNEMQLDSAFDLDALRDYVMGNITNNVEKASKRAMPDLDLNEFTLLSDDEVTNMQDTLNNPNITKFNIKNFTLIMCKELVPVSLLTLATNFEALADKLDKVQEDVPIVALRNNAVHLRAFQKFLYVPLLAIVNQIHKKLDEIKAMMYDGDSEDYGKSINKNIDNIKNLQRSIRLNGKAALDNMSNNMSEFVRRELDNYIRMVQAVDTNKIGSCKLLKRTQSQSDSFQFCKKIVQPMNNFWFGFLLSTILLLPALYVAHKLRCLIHREDIDDEDYEERSVHPVARNPDLYAPIPPKFHVAARPWERKPNPFSRGYPNDCHCPANFNKQFFGVFQYDLTEDPESVKPHKRKTD